MTHDRALKTLFIFNSIFVFGGASFIPLYAIFTEKIGAGALPTSLSWAAFMASATIFSLAVAKYGDRFKTKEYLLLAGYAIRAVVWFLYLYVNDIYVFIALQAVLGLGEALGTPAFEAIFANHLNKSQEMRQYSSWKAINNLVTAGGTIIGGIIVASFGFKPLFALMSLLAIISFVGIWSKPRNLL